MFTGKEKNGGGGGESAATHDSVKCLIKQTSTEQLQMEAISIFNKNKTIVEN
jgi:hypothetical protein